MKSLIPLTLLLLFSCGKLDVRTKPVEINHNFNTDGLFEVCESLGTTKEEVDQCKLDVLAAISNAGARGE
jgi:hypothetical protein